MSYGALRPLSPTDLDDEDDDDDAIQCLFRVHARAFNAFFFSSNLKVNLMDIFKV